MAGAADGGREITEDGNYLILLSPSSEGAGLNFERGALLGLEIGVHIGIRDALSQLHHYCMRCRDDVMDP